MIVLEQEIQAIQANAEQAARETRMGYDQISQAQSDRIRIIFEDRLQTTNREARIAAIKLIYPLSGRTGQPIKTFKDLSKAQAHALINYLYGQDGLSLDSELTWHGRQLLETIRVQLGVQPDFRVAIPVEEYDI